MTGLYKKWTPDGLELPEGSFLGLQEASLDDIILAAHKIGYVLLPLDKMEATQAGLELATATLEENVNLKSFIVDLLELQRMNEYSMLMTDLKHKGSELVGVEVFPQ